MKVAISLKPLSSVSYTRGVGAYTRELLSALQKGYPQDQFIATADNPYHESVDLVHFPFFDPFFLTLPFVQPKPTVVTIHDAIPLKYPAHFPPGLRGKLKWQRQKLAAGRTNAVITDSRASQADISRIFGLQTSKIHVIPLAPATDRGTITLESKVRSTYHLPRRYLLYVGDINWNKNIPGLISAFSALGSSTTHLVLVGKVFSDQPEIEEFVALTEAIKNSGVGDKIHLIGYVPSHHLPVIYRLATLYIQPSFDEGFGLPLLEAMKEGCPVLSSSYGSLPEVGGHAVSYFDPYKPSQFLRSLKSLLSSVEARRDMAESGKLHVKSFTWAKTASFTHAVYENILV